MSKFLKAVFPALSLNEETIHRKLRKGWILAFLLYIIIATTFISYVFYIENTGADLIKYLMYFMFTAIVSTIQCFASTIVSSLFDSIFFKKGLTMAQIIRAIFPCNLIYAYLYFLRNLIGLNFRTLYVVMVSLWFCINYFIAQRKAFQYNYFQAAVTDIIYIMIIALLS